MRSANIVLKDAAFTDELTDALKNAGALLCRKYEDDPAVYVSEGHGYFLVKLSEYEYDTFIRPVTHQDPGDFIVDYGEECPYSLLDLRKELADLARIAKYKLTAMPRTFDFPRPRYPDRKVLRGW